MLMEKELDLELLVEKGIHQEVIQQHYNHWIQIIYQHLLTMQ